MDIRALETFCKIMELRSFSKAAEAVHLTQPTVSGHIKALEERLQVKLFDRLGKTVAPTKAGELLYGYARKILAMKREAEQAIHQFKGSLKGSLVIGGSNIPGSYVLPPLMAAFKATHPEVAIVLKVGDSEAVCRAVADGSCELGVVGARFDEGRLAYLKFVEDELVLAVPADHPWAKRRSVTLKDLSRESFLVREKGSGSRRFVEKALEEAGVDVGSFKVVAELGSMEAIRSAVKLGCGVSFVSLRAIEEDVNAGSLAALRVQGVKLIRDFYIIHHKSRSRSPIAQAFLDFLLKEARR